MSDYGKQKEQVAIYVDNERLTHYGIKANMLAATMLAQGFGTTGGEIKGDSYTSPIYVSRPVNSMRDVENMIVFSTPSGSIVRVKDIARVVKEYPEPSSYITKQRRQIAAAECVDERRQQYRGDGQAGAGEA